MGYVGPPVCIVALMVVALRCVACGHAVSCNVVLCPYPGGCVVLCGCTSSCVVSGYVATRGVIPFCDASFRVWWVHWFVVSCTFRIALCSAVPRGALSCCVLACPAGVRRVGWCRSVVPGACGVRGLLLCVLSCRVLFCGTVLYCVVSWLLRCVALCCGVVRYFLLPCMVCCVVMCCVVSCCVVLCRVVLCSVLLRCVVLYDVVFRCVVLYCVVVCRVALDGVVLCYVMLRCVLLGRVVLCRGFLRGASCGRAVMCRGAVFCGVL